MLVLERLTDNDIRDITFSAVERVSALAPRDPAESEGACTSTPMDVEPSTSQKLLPQSESQSSTSFDRLSPPYPQLTDRIISSIISLSTGDARTALSLLELVLAAKPDIDEHVLLTSLRRSVSASYDRTGESHYDMISALHKSVRGSHGSAAMYWLARMLTAGEDPLYIARRLVVCASEDIGLADKHALPLVSQPMILPKPEFGISVSGNGISSSLPGYWHA